MTINTRQISSMTDTALLNAIAEMEQRQSNYAVAMAELLYCELENRTK